MSWLLLDGEEEGLQESEEEPLWCVVTAADEIVCPDCSPLEGEVYPESVLFEAFPEAEEVADGVVQLNVHAPRDYRCRCQAFVEQPAEMYPVGLEEEGGFYDAEVTSYDLLAGGFY